MEKKTFATLNQEAIDCFSDLAKNADNASSAYQYILNTFNKALSLEDTSALLNLTEYIEHGDGQITLQYYSEVHLFLRILYLTKLEINLQLIPFIKECKHTNTLLEKYTNILFALRRLTFCLSEDSVHEAISYLQSVPVSYLAIHTIIGSGKIATNDFFYELLLHTYQNVWSKNDINTFLSLINSK